MRQPALPQPGSKKRPRPVSRQQAPAAWASSWRCRQFGRLPIVRKLQGVPEILQPVVEVVVAAYLARQAIEAGSEVVPLSELIGVFQIVTLLDNRLALEDRLACVTGSRNHTAGLDPLTC